MHKYDHVIVDGYNLLHAVESASRHLRRGKEGLRRARETLVQLLSTARRASGPRITVVFDGGDAPDGLPRRSVQQGVEVVYAPRDSDADTLIRRMVDEADNRRRLLVVSSDRAVADYVRICGAGQMNSGRFASMLGDRRSPRRRAASTSDEKADAAAIDVEDWAAWMGLDIDE